MSGVLLLVGLCLGAVGAIVLIPANRAETPQLAGAGSDVATQSTAPPVTEPAPSPAPDPSPSPGTPPAQTIDADTLAGLVPNSELSVVVHDLTLDKDTVSVQPDRVYTSASLVKLLIALTALPDILAAGSSTERVIKMLAESDDSLASAMWSQYGGDAIVTRMASKLGLANTRPPVVAGRWGDTRTSAADVAKTYHYLMNDAGGGTKDVILRALDGTTEYGSDGIRQYFGIPDGVGDLRWQVKQGWSCCRDNRIIHSSGIVGGRYIVVVLTSQPTSLGYAAAGNRVTDVVEALRPALVVSN